MTNYLISRHGSSNACNRLGPLTIVEAPNKKEALRLAEVGPTYNNQFLVASTMSEAKTSEWNQAWENDALHEVHRKDCQHEFTDYGYQDFCCFCGQQKS